ncbi:MAG: site-specific integrase [SAR324 cluster bacterium]|nr:site-specific integrase [SAR324 cluster bacterium]
MDLPVQWEKARDLTPAQALKMLFEDFKPNTRRAYSRVFVDFQKWASIQNLEDLKKLNSLTILEYKAFLKNQGKKPASINQTMSALRKVFKVLTEFEYLPSNPFKSTIIRNEKVSDVSNKGSLRVAQLNAMMEANAREPYDRRVGDLMRKRNGLLLRFLYFTAARRGEVADLCWQDLLQDGAFHVAVIRNTKSGIPQRLKIRQELYEELQEWKEILRNHGLEEAWVFISLGFRTRGQKMTGKGVNDVIVRLGKAIGMDISAHYLRHTAITLALEMGESLQKVQAYARHSSANTTIRYYHDQEILRKNPTDSLPRI